MIRLKILILFSLLSWLPGFMPFSLAQETLRRENFEVSHFTMKDGLPMNEIKAITQDAKGFIWFTTVLGLIRFDGNDFEIFPIPLDHYPTAKELLSDAKGNIWIRTQKGVLLFRTDRKKFVSFQYTWVNPNGVLRNSVTKLAEDGYGNIWIGTQSGLNRLHFPDLDGQNKDSVIITRFYAERYPQKLRDLVKNWSKNKTPVAALIKEKRSKTFKLSHPTKLLIFSIGEWNALEGNWLDMNWISDQEGKKVWEMTYDQTKNAGRKTWFREQVATINLPAGAYYLHYQINRNASYDFDNRSSYPPALSDYWGVQIWEINREEDLLIQSLFKEEPSPFISANEILDLFTDRDGRLWVGSYKGLDQITSGHPNKKTRNIQHYESPYQLKKDDFPFGYDVSNLNILQEEDSTLLLIGHRLESRGNRIFITRFNKEKEEFRTITEWKYNRDSPLHYNRPVIIDDRKNIWSGNNGWLTLIENSLSRQSGETDVKSFVSAKFETSMVTDLYLDREGIIWAGTNRGLYQIKYDDNPLNFIPLPESKFSGYPTLSFAEDRDHNIWIGEKGRLLRFDVDEKKIDKIIQSPSQKGEDVFPFVDADSSLWVLFSEFGLYRWDPLKSKLSAVIRADSLGRGMHSFCGLTPDGLFLFSEKYLFAYHNPRFYLFDKDSLKSWKINFDTLADYPPSSFYFEPDHTVWTYHAEIDFGLKKFEYNRNGNFKLTDQFFEGAVRWAFTGNDRGKYWSTGFI